MAKNYNKELVQFGKKVKALRTKKNLTQVELAALIDVDAITIKRIEKGGYNPKYLVMLALANAFKVDIKELL